MLFIPFRRTASMLGKIDAVTPVVPVTDAKSEKARRIGWVLLRLSRYLPWRCMCFEQALAGIMLLKVYCLDGTIYFGVKKGAPKMTAHAWLRCGDQIITGAAGHEQFTVLFTVATKNNKQSETIIENVPGSGVSP